MFFRNIPIYVLALTASSAWGLHLNEQTPLQQAFHTDGLFTPLETLSSLSFSEFTTLEHPFFPRHNVRVKKSRFCDETANAYTGYIDIEARHLFFYFFESRNSPATDDVIFWTNGGPGCSSSMGLFMELGPCRISNENGTVFHPESWNTNANIFFIDQPVGVGFSYADHGESVATSEDAANDVAAFVSIFFEHFTQFKGRAFHMAGESYAGHYIPLMASAIHDQNLKLISAGLTPVNLQSIMIGNGMVDTFQTVFSWYDMQCTAASGFSPVLDIATCVAQKSLLQRCKNWTKAACEDQYDDINCNVAFRFCWDTYADSYYASGMNPYDISKQCEGDIEETMCYPQTKFINHYLDNPDVRTLLGVDDAVSENFKGCSDVVASAFEEAHDIVHSSASYVAALLEHGVRVLIYVGVNDWISNYIGQERWTLGLEWSGQSEFSNKKLDEWLVHGKPAGKTRRAGGLTYATIYGAGHMAPYDKPKESLELVRRWIAGTDL